MLLCLLMLCASACVVNSVQPAQPSQNIQPVQPVQPEKPEQIAPDAANTQTAPQTFAYTLDEQTYSAKADDGTLLIQGSSAFPVVTLADKGAEQAMNSHFAEEKRDYDEDFAEYTADARELIGMRGAEDFPTYEFTLGYSTERSDSAVVSFVEDSYVFLGGAHGSSIREGVTFDIKTGHDLELEDISTVSEEEAEKFVLDYLKVALKEKQYTDLGLFDGYEDYLQEVVDDDECWYMTDDAVVIIINDTVIASHAAGMIEVPIPYADFTILKSEYLPA